MNRIIKFRGKRIDTGEWVIGGAYKHDPPLVCFGKSDEQSRWYIIKTGFADWQMPRPMDAYEVDPSTVGQFTGLHDKDGKEIYEGDILNSASWVGNSRTLNKNNVVEWNRCGWKAMGYNGTIMVNPDLDVKADFVIIGNIHDNQDLIESK